MYGSAETTKVRVIQIPRGPAIVMSMADLEEKYEYAGSRTIEGLLPEVDDVSVLNAVEFYHPGVVTSGCQKSNESGD